MEVYLLSLASLQKEEIQQKVVDLLSETDRIGIEEIKSQKKRLTFLGGRILLEYVAHLHGLDTFHLAYGKNGKPYFSDIRDFFFNISHSGDYLILAWSCHEIGKSVRNCPDFQKRCFHQQIFPFGKSKTIWIRLDVFLNYGQEKKAIRNYMVTAYFEKQKNFLYRMESSFESLWEHQLPIFTPANGMTI